MLLKIQRESIKQNTHLRNNCLNMENKYLSIFFNITFFGVVFLAFIYIATIEHPGIYYDYLLINEYQLINDLNSGAISAEKFLSLLPSYDRKIEGIILGTGRFHPFYLIDLLFVIKYFGAIKWAWFYKAVLFLIFISAQFRTTERLISNKYLAGITTLLLFLHPGFWYIWTTLASTTEAQAMAFLALGLFFYMRFSDKGGAFNAILCIGSMFISFGFKEPVFVAVGVFAAIHALYSFRCDDVRLRKMDGLLLAAAFLFFLIYFTIAIWPLIRDGIGSQGLYFHMKNRGAGMEYGFGVFFHHLKTYARTDPLLVFLMMPLAVMHFVQLATRPSSARDKLVAAFFAGGVVWLLQLIVIGISDAYFQYYAVPAYCFSIPALTVKLAEIFSVCRNNNCQSRRLPMKVSVTVIIVLSLGVQLVSRPEFLNNRSDFQLWAKTIDEAAHIVRQNQPDKTYFYFYNSPRSTSVEILLSFTSFMGVRGLFANNFDLTYSSNNDIAWVGHQEGLEFGSPEDPWGWRRNFRARPMQVGDILIVTPWGKFNEKKEIEMVLEGFDLAFSTGALYGCETFSLGSAKRFLHRLVSLFLVKVIPTVADTLMSAKKIKIVNSDKNYGKCSPSWDGRNYYIFEKKQRP